MAEQTGQPVRYEIEIGLDPSSQAPYVKITDRLAPFTPLVLSPEDAASIAQGMTQGVLQIFQQALHQCAEAQKSGPRIVRPRS